VLFPVQQLVNDLAAVRTKMAAPLFVHGVAVEVPRAPRDRTSSTPGRHAGAMLRAYTRPGASVASGQAGLGLLAAHCRCTPLLPSASTNCVSPLAGRVLQKGLEVAAPCRPVGPRCNAGWFGTCFHCAIERIACLAQQALPCRKHLHAQVPSS
jgi:hypothetical protein